ncbi:MAG: ferredoxin--NADP reductase [Haloarculaceae archaeon]
MDSVREHMSHHDDPDEMPLLTEEARVAAVTAMDDDRSAAVRRETARVLRELDAAHLVEAGDPPTVDWEGAESLVDAGAGLAAKLSDLVERYRRPSPSLLSVRLREEGTPIDFVPGQYVTIRFHDTPRPYSIASSPNREYLELCIRRVPGGRLTPDLFEALDPGDEVVARGPNGDFVLDDPNARDLAFLATGTGVAPLKSMVEYVFEEGLDVHEGTTRDVWVFLGCSWRDDLPYRERFRELAATHDNFHFVPTLSREEHLTQWDGETAYVQETFVKYLDADARERARSNLDASLAPFLDAAPETDVDARIDPSNLDVYSCGINAMVERLVDVARQVGVPPERADGEGFG